MLTGQRRPDLSNVNRLVSRVALSAPALAAVAVPADLAGAAPPMTDPRYSVNFTFNFKDSDR
jgi:hypothetical protein